MAEYTILLEGLEVTIGLGIHDHERAAPQRVALQLGLQVRTELQEVRIQLRVSQLLRGQRAHAPVRALEALVYRNVVALG